MPETLVESLNKLLKENAGLEGLDIPHREVLPAEFSEKLAKVEGFVTVRDETIKTITAEKADLQKQIEAFKAKEASATRIAAVNAKATSILKDNKYAEVILDAITAASVSDSFTEKEVDGLVATKTAEIEKLAKLFGAKAPGSKLTTAVEGADVDDADLDSEEDEEPAAEAVQPYAGGLFRGKKKTAK